MTSRTARPSGPRTTNGALTWVTFLPCQSGFQIGDSLLELRELRARRRGLRREEPGAGHAGRGHQPGRRTGMRSSTRVLTGTPDCGSSTLIVGWCLAAADLEDERDPTPC
jgi:hypothetical protein